MAFTTLGVRMDEGEKAILEAIAEARGVTLSDLVREALGRLAAEFRAIEAVREIKETVEKEFAERLGVLRQTEEALQEKIQSLSQHFMRLLEVEAELLRQEKEESDPLRAAEMLEEAAKLKLTREAITARLEEARRELGEIQKEIAIAIKEKTEAEKARLREAFPSVAEPLFEGLIAELNAIFTILAPYLQAVYRVEKRTDVLKWLRMRVSEALRAQNPDAYAFLGAPTPINREKYSSWAEFWRFWAEWVR